MSKEKILYFWIPHNTLCLPPNFAFNIVFKCSWKYYIFARAFEDNNLCKIGEQTKCIMGDSKIVKRGTVNRIEKGLTVTRALKVAISRRCRALLIWTNQTKTQDKKVLDSGFRIPSQWNFYSGFKSFYSNVQDSGLHKTKFPDSWYHKHKFSGLWKGAINCYWSPLHRGNGQHLDVPSWN